MQSKKEVKKDMNNPFFTEFKTAFQVPPFNEIKLNHFVPAIDFGIEDQLAEIKAITDILEPPTFDNTILAFDQSGILLSRTALTFFKFKFGQYKRRNADNCQRNYAKDLQLYRDNIALNKKLFARVKSIYDKRNELNLNAHQKRVVEKYYLDFERNGANLPHDKQIELRKLNNELSMLELKFGENNLAETNKNFKLIIENEADLKRTAS